LKYKKVYAVKLLKKGIVKFNFVAKFSLLFVINEEKISYLKAEIVTVITRKVWNMKAALKHLMLLQSEYLTHYVKWVCLQCTILVPQVHWNI